MKKLVYILIISISLTGCKSCKKALHKTEVHGTVTDDITGEPISNLKISLIGADYDFNSNLPSTGDNNNYVYTDSEGSYKFNFDRSAYGTFYLYCNVNKYEYDQIGSFADYIKLEFSKKRFKEVITKNITLKSFGVLKVHCKHVNSDTTIYVGIIPIISKDLGVNPGLFYPTVYNDERNLVLYNYAYKPIKFSFQACFNNYITGQYCVTKDTILTLSKKDTTYYQFNY